MISDDQLYQLAIFLGSVSMLLIVLYHFLEVNAENDDKATPLSAERKADTVPGAKPLSVRYTCVCRMGLELQGMRREIERGETKDTEDSVVDLTWLGVLRSYKSRSLLSALCMRSAVFIAQGTGDTKMFVRNAMYALLGIVICTRRRNDCCSMLVRRLLMSYPSVLICLHARSPSESRRIRWITWSFVRVHDLVKVFVVKKVAPALCSHQRASSSHHGRPNDPVLLLHLLQQLLVVQLRSCKIAKSYCVRFSCLLVPPFLGVLLRWHHRNDGCHQSSPRVGKISI
ncbi:hypothetical protein D6C90_08318 [Aureobasidium pullulans]|uniref:Dolichyl-diphosphooligosaccharide--protein glycosyltransferase subunit 4 n=1 Tax=Aureobasidium pullulans TaxID=5580 RepID=A0A4S9BEY2_AURPU|nr:hypothetical protein D6D15_04069 [Aureobasidium pullulans]THX40684.1 hypothetical protein D6D11_08619 [Aureobasidium pullulans]THZ33504.1 hypothetical protein D6C90_08318 [Aureobasidium pullulans]